MNRKCRKLRYIQIKNSWHIPGKKLNPFIITTLWGNYDMDFRNRDKIVRHGVLRIK